MSLGHFKFVHFFRTIWPERAAHAEPFRTLFILQFSDHFAWAGATNDERTSQILCSDRKGCGFKRKNAARASPGGVVNIVSCPRSNERRRQLFIVRWSP